MLNELELAAAEWRNVLDRQQAELAADEAKHERPSRVSWAASRRVSRDGRMLHQHHRSIWPDVGQASHSRATNNT